MSYDIYLKDPVTRHPLTLDEAHHMVGGTYALGGTKDMELNITYNYSPHYKPLGEKGIREIYGKTGAESLPMLEALIDKLADDIASDYWEPTEGNAKKALFQLVSLAKMRPDGVWDGD
jgi:hypothetical protein